MKIALHLFWLYLATWHFTTNSQEIRHAIAANGIYLTEDDFVHHKLIMAFEKNDKQGMRFRTPLTHNRELWVKTKDSTYKFFNDDIWGYRENNNDERIYSDEDYKVEYIGKIIIYSTPSDPTTEGTSWTSYFSRDLHSPVHELSKKNLIETYHDNPHFVERIKKLNWTQSIFKINKETGEYRFIDWL